MGVAREYGCLMEDKGIIFNASYLIDPKGVPQQITTNGLPNSITLLWSMANMRTAKQVMYQTH